MATDDFPETLERIQASGSMRIEGGWTLDDEILLACCAHYGMTQLETSRLLRRSFYGIASKAQKISVAFARYGLQAHQRNMALSDAMSRYYRWTPERVELLKNCWAKGLEVRQIRQILQHLTGKAPGKNSVIGKAHRLGLPPHKPPPDRYARLPHRPKEVIRQRGITLPALRCLRTKLPAD